MTVAQLLAQLQSIAADGHANAQIWLDSAHSYEPLAAQAVAYDEENDAAVLC